MRIRLNTFAINAMVLIESHSLLILIPITCLHKNIVLRFINISCYHILNDVTNLIIMNNRASLPNKLKHLIIDEY